VKSIFIKIGEIIPDQSDRLLYLGLGFLFFGIRQISIPYSFITVGILFMLIAILPLLKSRDIEK